MPPIDSNEITINVTYNPSIDLTKNQHITNKLSYSILQFLSKEYPNTIKYISLNLWTKTSWDPTQAVLYGSSWSDNYSTLILKLIDKDDRKITSYDIKESLQTYIDNNITKNQDISENLIKEILVSTQKAWPGTWKPILLQFKWENTNDISNYIDTIYYLLQKTEGTFNWWSSLEFTNGKIKIIWDLNKMKEFDINPMIANTMIIWVQNSINYEPNGILIKKLFEFGDNEVEIKSYLNYKWEIQNLKIWDIYISQFIKKIEILPEIKIIDHLDWKIVIKVDADKRKEFALWQVIDSIEKTIKWYPIPSNIEFSYGNDIEEEKQSNEDMWSAMQLWLILMFAVLILQFNNFRYPIIIMSSLPLLAIWAFWLLGLLQIPFSMPAQLGMFGLLWVWVNNAILLIESYKSRLKQYNCCGINMLIESVNIRLKPIFLTTLTTVAWLTTLALKDELWASLAIAFIWWLLFGAFIITIYIPCILRFCNKDTEKCE